MARKPKVTEGSGNVFADLGLIDAEQHQMKARLVSRIAKTIRQRNLTQSRRPKS